MFFMQCVWQANKNGGLKPPKINTHQESCDLFLSVYKKSAYQA